VGQMILSGLTALARRRQHVGSMVSNVRKFMSQGGAHVIAGSGL